MFINVISPTTTAMANKSEPNCMQENVCSAQGNFMASEFHANQFFPTNFHRFSFMAPFKNLNCMLCCVVKRIHLIYLYISTPFDVLRV